MNSKEREPLSAMISDDETWNKCDVEPMTSSYIASDVHLQNLGLSMTSGKPRFKINEMCSSFATSSVCQPNFHDDKDSTPSESFVVLSHPSLEMVQAQSLANYIQIQEKYTSIDTSVISNMSPLEIEQKLSDLLQENAKLKETLIENNMAMKKQFNSLVAWQESISSVHQNHKEKFAETRELIDQLKKENTKLKIQVSMGELQNASLSKTSAENHSLQLSLTQGCGCSCRTELYKILNEKMRELIDHDQNCKKLVEDLNATTENSNNDLMEECQTLHETNKDPILPTIKFDEAGKETIPAKETVTNLEQHIDNIDKNVITLIQLPDYVESIVKRIPRTEFRQELINTMKPYNESLEVLINCFSVQSSRYVRMQECLKKCIEILQNCETFNSPNDRSDTIFLLNHKNSLSEYRQKLIDEQLENIDDHQKWIRIQNHLKKLFYDYTSTLCELEILQENNRKLTSEFENSHENVQCDKHFGKEKTVLEDELKVISLEKLSLHEEKKSLDKLQKSLVINQESLNIEVEKIKQERLNLLEEKIALDRQSNLYEEQEKALMNEKKNYMKMSEELTEKIESLEEMLKKQNEATYVDKENLMILRAQVDIYRTDFEQEKASKKNLIREKNKLIDQIQALTVQNQDLRKHIDQLRQGQQTSLSSSTTSQRTSRDSNSGHSNTSRALPSYTCPLCNRTFATLEPLLTHTEECVQ